MGDRERIQDYLQPFELLSDAVIAIDADFQILYANPTAQKSFGLDCSKEAPAIYEQILVEEPPLDPKSLVATVADQGAWSGLARLGGSAFEPQWVDWTMQRIAHPDLERPCFLNILCNVSERIAAEGALRESEQRIRFVTDNMFDLVSLADAEGRIEYASPSHERILGYAPHQLVGTVAFDLVHPDDQERVFREVAAGQETGELRRTEVRFRHSNGDNVWLECMGRIIAGSDDRPAQMIFSSRDVSARRQTQLELDDSQRRYQALFENMTSGVAVYEAMNDGADFLFRDFNAAAERATGLARLDVIGRRLSEVFPGMIEMGLHAVFQKVWRTGEPAWHEASQYVDERLTAWFDNHIYRLPTGEVVAVFDDVTTKAAAREELRLRDEALQSIFRAAAAGIGVVRDRVMLRVNRQVCEMVGRTEEELVGQDTQMLYPSQEEYKHVGTEKYRQIETDGVGTVETRWQRANGEIIDVLLSSTPIDPKDLKAGVTFTALDITARKQVARQQAATIQVLELLNSAGGGESLIRDILVVLKEYTACDAVALRLRDKEDYPFYNVSGLSPSFVHKESSLLSYGEDGKVRLGPDGRPKLRCLCGAVIRGDLDSSLPCVTTSGSFWTGSIGELWATTPPIPKPQDVERNCHIAGYESMALVPLRSDTEVIGLLQIIDPRKSALTARMVAFFEQIGTSIGIALARIQAGEQRQNLEHQLQQSQKMEAVGRLAGGVAHDFNNLLTAIGGYSQLLLDALDEADPLREDVQEIEDAADRATELTQQLLAFSRRQIVSPKIIDPNRVIARSEKMLRRIIGEDVALEFLHDDDVGSVEIDPGQLDQILVNLSVNARDAMPQGGRLVIETTLWSATAADDPVRPQLRTGEFVRLEVSDTGEGIPEEALPHIFDPFFSTKATGQGTGLGLATVYGIVSQNKGFIEARSTPGHSTTITIYFPRIKRAPQTLDEVPKVKSRRGKETILLVEDEDSLRGLAKKILKRHGYQVLDASNGGEAYLMSQQLTADIDLLLTDVVMPNMNGKQLYESLQRQRPDLKVLFMSGYTDAVIAHHGLLDQDIDFLQKPFTFDSLTHKVRDVLDR